MRAAILAGITLLGACQDLTSLTPDRVPPPDRNRIDEGTLDDPTDPCGALDVGAPRRLSATLGPSDGVHMAVLPRAGGETWVGLAWLEHGSEDPPSSPRFAVQVLLADGIPFGATERLRAETPQSVDIAARPGSDEFVVVTGDEDLGSTLSVITPREDVQQPLDDSRSIALPDMERPVIALAQDHGFVIGLAPGSGERRPIALDNVTITDREISLQASVLPRLRAVDAALSTSGGQTSIVWHDGTTVKGAPLRQTGPGAYDVAAASERETWTPFPLRRSHGTTDLAVAFSSDGYIQVLRLEETEWKGLVLITDEQTRVEALASTRGESGARWAIARTWSPGDGSLREVRIERFQTGEPACATPGECVRVTTDLHDSSEPDIVAVDDGYLVAWSDAAEGDQTDVFVAHARCHATTNPSADQPD